jgi:methylmalonyl-CoA mutase
VKLNHSDGKAFQKVNFVLQCNFSLPVVFFLLIGTVNMNKIRILTATSLFDGHDVSINIMRRMLQRQGAELIHLGHNISAAAVVEAAVQEDVHAVAVSSYQGGHMEYFPYVRKLLDENNCSHVKIFGGGGGVILPAEIEQLEKSGVEKIYSPQDGQKMGFDGIIADFIARCDFELPHRGGEKPQFCKPSSIASWISFFENTPFEEAAEQRKYFVENRKKVPVLGISGTGGAGKSSMIDELIRRFIFFYPEIRIGIICVDPTKKKTGGALLGDRIRMNSLRASNTYMRSMATRESAQVLSSCISDVIGVFENTDLDLIILETCGIGQNDTSITDFSDSSLYIMTPEYGAATQLEKIEMLDEADFIALNKVEKIGGEDALRDVRHQYLRNKDFTISENEIPVFGTTASQFNNPGLTELFFALVNSFNNSGYLNDLKRNAQELSVPEYSGVVIPPERSSYLAEISGTIHNYHQKTAREAKKLRTLQRLEAVRDLLKDKTEVETQIQAMRACVDSTCVEALQQYVLHQQNYSGDEYCYMVRDKEFKVGLNTISLSGTKIPKIALPRYTDWGDRLFFMRSENLPGFFPFTAGVFPFKRTDESPKRQFAGEGGPLRTNRRFHYLCEGEPAKRLSVAFDSVTLYGEDPAERPDIFGKIGESGVSVCTQYLCFHDH